MSAQALSVALMRLMQQHSQLHEAAKAVLLKDCLEAMQHRISTTLAAAAGASADDQRRAASALSALDYCKFARQLAEAAPAMSKGPVVMREVMLPPMELLCFWIDQVDPIESSEWLAAAPPAIPVQLVAARFVTACQICIRGDDIRLADCGYHTLTIARGCTYACYCCISWPGCRAAFRVPTAELCKIAFRCLHLAFNYAVPSQV